MSEVLHALRDEYVQLADAYEYAQQAGYPVIDLGKRLLVAREELQTAQSAIGAQKDTVWGVGCQMCAYTGEGWLHGTLGGDGWTGKPCPHCIPGGENYMEIDEPEDDEPAPLCHECGQMIDGWAHSDGFGNYHCDKCCPTCDHIEDSRWCECTDQAGSGPCPVCGGELFPF
jgi:hypothetical protein